MMNAVRFVAVNSDVPHVLFTFIVPVMNIRHKDIIGSKAVGLVVSGY